MDERAREGAQDRHGLRAMPLRGCSQLAHTRDGSRRGRVQGRSHSGCTRMPTHPCTCTAERMRDATRPRAELPRAAKAAHGRDKGWRVGPSALAMDAASLPRGGVRRGSLRRTRPPLASHPSKIGQSRPPPGTKGKRQRTAAACRRRLPRATWRTRGKDAAMDEYRGGCTAAACSRQHAHAHAGAAACAKVRCTLTRCAELEARGDAHRFEVVRLHAVTLVRARLRGHRTLLDEVGLQKRPSGTRKQHTRTSENVNGEERGKGSGKRGAVRERSPSQSVDRWR